MHNDIVRLIWLDEREGERERGLLVVGIDLRGRGERKVRLVKDG